MSAAALPFIGRGALGGLMGLLGLRSARGATQMSPEERAALTSSTNLANLLGTQSQQLFGGAQGLLRGGQSAIGQAQRFFFPLVAGSRSQMLQATAPERGQITSFFRGAERDIRAQGRGGTRDLALAEASRERAGALAGLVPGIRPGAASALGGLGLQTAGLGAGLAGTAQAGTAAGANIFGNLLGTQQRGRLGGAEISRLAGADIGSFITELLAGGNKGGGGKGVLPTSGTFAGLSGRIPLPG